MKNRGFTLLELLGVIVILALLTTLVFPSVLNAIKKSSNETDKLSMDLINNATDLYIENHANDFEKINGSKFIIDMNELIEEGFLPESIKLTDVEKIEENYVLVKYDNDKFNYEVKSKNDFHNITGTNNLVLGSDNYNILNYKIYGNSVQNGTPTPETPVEIESVGDKTSNIVDLSQTKPATTTQHVTFDYDNLTGTLELTSEPYTYDYLSISSSDLGLEIGKTYYYGAIIEVSGKKTADATVVVFSLGKVKMMSFHKDETRIINDSFTYTGQDKTFLRMNFNYGSIEPAKVTIRNIYVSEVKPEFEPYGKYKIPVKISNGTEEITTNIYLDEPLRKIKDYADYIDFENKKVFRNVGQEIYDENTSFNLITSTYFYEEGVTTAFVRDIPTNAVPNAFGMECLTNLFEYKKASVLNKSEPYISGNVWSLVFAVKNETATTVEELKTFIADNNMEIIYPLKEETEEEIELPNIPTLEGTTILSVDTAIQPSNIEIFGYNDN